MQNLVDTPFPPLSKQEKRELYKDITYETREKLVMSHCGCVKDVMRKYAPALDYIGAEREDVFSECLLALWRASASFDPEKGDFSTLTYICTQNCIRIMLRHSKNHPYPKESLDEPIPGGRHEDSHAVEKKDLLQDDRDPFGQSEILLSVESLIKSMKPRDQEIIRMNLSGMRQCAIARKTGLAQPTVSRILKTFQNRLAVRIGKP